MSETTRPLLPQTPLQWLGMLALIYMGFVLGSFIPWAILLWPILLIWMLLEGAMTGIFLAIGWALKSTYYAVTGKPRPTKPQPAPAEPMAHWMWAAPTLGLLIGLWPQKHIIMELVT